MARLPHLAGALTYAAAWLIPWRSVYRVRAHHEDLTFLVHRRDVIGRHIAKYGTHEAVLTTWLAHHLAGSPPGIVVDVGANMGWHAVHASRHPAVETVVAFEPDAFNAWLLERNLSINKVSNVVVCAHALGARPGLAKLHRYKPSNLGRHSLIADYGRDAKLVPVRDLDGTLDDLNLADRRILLLKIDVEGYEPAVIDGASRALIRADVVVIECSPALSGAGGLSIDRMIDRLHHYGFKSSALGADGRLTAVAPERVRAIEGQMDVIWTR